ncbi:glycosyltransferase family 2 protein [Yeosuana sp. MJ-SS3]|uniref:Glycosyltransferase family 2 protein n=1 Tax=Gilvirhabdus luticola TaxID=3079858 RepID=A0ABU3U585_9FLAO|nr:glycosyltransferase family 2 protein [Yeosuana sp. MJ-SS3]MDU8885477.1 glycosyltransferase family 2 protein [Yeosuana sp. MJ-SS3]
MIEHKNIDLPLVTIIIPVFNRHNLIKIALDSVLNQTYNHWECLVVDDGSTDNTIDSIKYYSQNDKRIRCFQRHRKPKGAPTCRNIGLNNAKGDYVIFLDSDDYLLPFCLEKRIEAIKQYPNCDFLVFPMGVKKRNNIKKKDMSTNNLYLVEFLSANVIWQTMCPIWKKSFIKKLNGFTEGYPRFNDPELMIRALLHHNVNFKVLHDLNYDSVFSPSIKKDTIFINKIYKSLQLFIPDTVANLKKSNNYSYRFYLIGYLHYWFKYVYVPSNSKDIIQSMKLLNMFKIHNIISGLKWMDLTARLKIYITSKLIMGKPMDKLTQKAVYIKHK